MKIMALEVHFLCKKFEKYTEDNGGYPEEATSD